MQALSMLIKPASGSCNMRCRYCFYADVTDLRQVKTHGIMHPDTLETIVRKALGEAEKFCSFGFQGGEPTLAGLDFFRRLIELEQQYNVNKVQIHHAIQTNGLTVDKKWAEFFARNHFLVGLSIDSGKTVHDEFRLNPARKGTHNRCMATARLFREHGVEFNILSVVTRQLAAHPDKAYRFYKQNGFRYLQFIPCLDGLEEAHGSNDYSLDARSYGRFLCRIFDLWYEDFIQGDYYSIRNIDNDIHMLMGHPPENCAMSGRCNAYALIEADGGVYPCDFYAVDRYCLGNINTHSFEEMLTGEAAREFIRPSLQPDPDCMECPYGFLCRGGCRRDREPVRDGTAGKNVYCEAFRQFFLHALPRMQEIAAQLAGAAQR